MAEFMLYVNLLVGGAGSVVYGMWAGKWLRRKAWVLFTLNALVSGTIGLVVLGYAALAQSLTCSTVIEPSFFRYLLPFIIGVPALARYRELRRDEEREVHARDAIRSLAKRANDLA